VFHTSSEPKKGAFGFFLFEKSNSGERHCSLIGDRENQAEKFSQIWRALKKYNLF
jgi:hypothetical protein